MKKAILFLLGISCFLNVFLISSVNAGVNSFTQKDRELLIRLEERLNQIEKRLEELRIDTNKRFEQVDKRIAELREDMNKRFESLQNLMMAIIGAFATIVAVAIGFAIWDRRTMVRPFEDKVKKIESDIVSDRKRLESLLEALRNYAQKNPDLADILKQFSIL